MSRGGAIGLARSLRIAVAQATALLDAMAAGC